MQTWHDYFGGFFNVDYRRVLPTGANLVTQRRVSSMALILCAMCLWADMDSTAATAGEVIYKPFRGLCYGPYRKGQDPDLNIQPSEVQLTEDLATIQSLACQIRTYGVNDALYKIPALCSSNNIACYPGAWIESGSTAILTANEQQLTNLIKIGLAQYPTTKGLIVGNEYLDRHEQTDFANAKTLLNSYIQRVKSLTGQKVGTACGWHIWNNDYVSDVAANVDFLLMHVHPFHESQYYTPNLTITNAFQHVTNRYYLIKQKYPGKHVIIGETGWPTAGLKNYGAVPSPANQARFLLEFASWARTNDVDYFFFSAFDEPYKQKYAVAEGYWGVLSEPRPFSPKTALVQWLTDGCVIDWQHVPAQIQVSTFEGNRYTWASKTNLLDPAWTVGGAFVGQTGTNRTIVSLPASTNSASFIRVRMDF